MRGGTITPDSNQKGGYDPNVYDTDERIRQIEKGLREQEERGDFSNVGDEAEDFLRNREAQAGGEQAGGDTVGSGYNVAGAAQGLAEKGLEAGLKKAGLDKGVKTGKFFGKKLLVGGIAAGAIVLPIFAFAIIMFMLAPYKEIHFGTVLGSAGFAEYNLLNKKFFARTIFDAAVLTSDSTGTKDPTGRSLIDRLTRVNPDKALAKLGREGTLQFKFDGDKKWGGLKTTNNFKGVQVYNDFISLDDIARQTGGKPFNQLSPLQKLDAKYAFIDKVQGGLSERLASEPRSFNESWMKGLRSTLGIHKWKWRNKAKAYSEYTSKKAFSENMKALIEKVRARASGVSSSSSDVNDEAKNYTEESIKDAVAGRKPKEAPGHVRSRWARRAATVSKASDVVFATTLACIVHDLKGSFDEIDRQQDTRAITLTHDFLTTNDQIKSGDTVEKAAGADTLRLSDAGEEGKDTAEKSTLYRLSTHQDVNNIELKQLDKVPSLRPSSAFRDLVAVTDQFLFGTPAGDIFDKGWLQVIGFIINPKKVVAEVGCPVILNTAVQWTLAGGELVFTVVSGGATKGATAAVKLAAMGALKLAGTVGMGELLGMMIDASLRNYSGTDYSGIERGRDLFDRLYIGYERIGMMGVQKALFGRVGTDDEFNTVQKRAMNEIWEENKRKPFTQRYFALSNPYSLASKLAVTIPTGFTSFADSMRQGLASFGSILTLKVPSYISSIFTGRTSAAVVAPNLKDGVTKYVWTPEELQKIDKNPSYQAEANNAYVLPRLNELNDKYAKCYNFYLQIDEPKTPLGTPYCTPQLLSSEDALHWRWFMAESTQAEVNGANNGLYNAPDILSTMGVGSAN